MSVLPTAANESAAIELPELTQVIPTAAPVSIVEAIPA
jgi:hypothetical protein